MINELRMFDRTVKRVLTDHHARVSTADQSEPWPEPDPSERFWDHWPMDEYDTAVAECREEIGWYFPKRHNPSYRVSLVHALDQARYLGLRDKAKARSAA